jgi:hypothetical protein
LFKRPTTKQRSIVWHRFTIGLKTPFGKASFDKPSALTTGWPITAANKKTPV